MSFGNDTNKNKHQLLLMRWC